MGDERTFRCGWRVVQPVEIDARVDRWGDLQFPMLTVRRGEFRAVIDPRTFDAMSDEEFVEAMEYGYRKHAFDQMQQDLDVLARQLIGELDQGSGMLVTGVPYDDITAALYRWQKVKRDTEETAT